MIKFEYDSNNSGGRWWLKDEDWLNLENEGWQVQWFENEPGNVLRKKGQKRWLGALAMKASKEFYSEREAIAEFERITNQEFWEVGCECCGPPHSFTWTDQEGHWHYTSP